MAPTIPCLAPACLTTSGAKKVPIENVRYKMPLACDASAGGTIAAERLTPAIMQPSSPAKDVAIKIPFCSSPRRVLSIVLSRV